MTEKRFQYNVNKNSIEYNEKHFAYCNGEQNKIANKLNELAEENEQLKQVAKDFVENPTQHNLWKLRTFVLKDSDME